MSCCSAFVFRYYSTYLLNTLLFIQDDVIRSDGKFQQRPSLPHLGTRHLAGNFNRYKSTKTWKSWFVRFEACAVCGSDVPVKIVLGEGAKHWIPLVFKELCIGSLCKIVLSIAFYFLMYILVYFKINFKLVRCRNKIKYTKCWRFYRNK